MNPHPTGDTRALLVAELLGRPADAHAVADPLRPILASLFAGRALAQGQMSATLGLPVTDLLPLWDAYFPGPPLHLNSGSIDDMPELSDLVGLLLQYRAGQRESELWLAHIVAWGCAGRDHLWQDLGLANRGELSALMQTAFPGLSALNTSDMKWKKFIYRHYCSTEGIYVCPAPSCSQCTDFDKCHAPEE